MVQIPVLYRTKDFQNSTNKKCLPLVLTYYLKQYRHRQPNPDSHSPDQAAHVCTWLSIDHRLVLYIQHHIGKHHCLFEFRNLYIFRFRNKLYCFFRTPYIFDNPDQNVHLDNILEEFLCTTMFSKPVFLDYQTNPFEKNKGMVIL